jgi:hypothetical protein
LFLLFALQELLAAQALLPSGDKGGASSSKFSRHMGSGKSADVRTLDRAVTIAVRVVRARVEAGFEVAKLIVIRLEKVGRWRRVLVEPLFINRGV